MERGLTQVVSGEWRVRLYRCLSLWANVKILWCMPEFNYYFFRSRGTRSRATMSSQEGARRSLSRLDIDKFLMRFGELVFADSKNTSITFFVRRFDLQS